MRFLILVCFLTFSSSLSFVSTAQDKAESNTADSQSSQHQSAEDTAKSNEEAGSEKVMTESKEFDLDSFFKQGEESAKKGSSCEKPTAPIA